MGKRGLIILKIMMIKELHLPDLMMEVDQALLKDRIHKLTSRHREIMTRWQMSLLAHNLARQLGICKIKFRMSLPNNQLRQLAQRNLQFLIKEAYMKSPRIRYATILTTLMIIITKAH